MHRHESNPLITPDMVAPSNPNYQVCGAFNPGAVRFGDEILLLVRVAENVPAGEGRAAVPIVRFDDDGNGRPDVLDVSLDDPEVRLKDTRGIVYRGVDYLSTLSHLRLARSRDGVHFDVDREPFLFPSDASEVFGVEDARVTRIDDTYWINYTCVSIDGWATALASTTDFRTVHRHGIIFPPQNKDVSILPGRIGDRFCALHRPNNSGFGKPSIWYADSPDLLHWGHHKCLLRARETKWEEQKIGGGAPSILTSEGWLQVYHGKGRDAVYSLFTLLLDSDDPSRVLKQTERPVLHPECDYETIGFFPNVVFSNGIVSFDDGTLFVYYGACDEAVCLARTTVNELLSSLVR